MKQELSARAAGYPIPAELVQAWTFMEDQGWGREVDGSYYLTPYPGGRALGVVFDPSLDLEGQFPDDAERLESLLPLVDSYDEFAGFAPTDGQTPFGPGSASPRHPGARTSWSPAVGCATSAAVAGCASTSTARTGPARRRSWTRRRDALRRARQRYFRPCCKSATRVQDAT